MLSGRGSGARISLFMAVVTNWRGEAVGDYGDYAIRNKGAAYRGYSKASIYRVNDRKALFSKTFTEQPPRTIPEGVKDADGCNDAEYQVSNWLRSFR